MATFIGLVFMAWFYFLPTIVAFDRGHLSAKAILVINLFLGWMPLAWIAALAWAFTSNTRANRERSKA